MTLTVYKNFSKKKNSTKIPSSGGTDIEVVLKAGTSIESPTFLVDGIDLDVNYCHWENHYYFVTDIMLGNNNIYEIQCRQDVMATYRSEILASSQYVVRSASKSNGYILDGMYPATDEVSSTFTIQELSSKPLFPFSMVSGYYVLGIVAKGDTTQAEVGCNTYYILDNTQMRNFVNVLLGSTDYIGTVDIGDNLLKTLFNPIQYIASCTWIPWKPSNTLDVQTINLGWFPISCGASIVVGITNTLVSNTCTIVLSDHPQISRGKYLNGAPYTTRTLDAGPFGIIPLDTTKLVDSTQLTLTAYCDIFSGAGYLYIDGNSSTGSGTQIARGQIGVNIPLAQISHNIFGGTNVAISGAATTAVNAAAENYAGAAVSLATTAMDACQAALPQMQTTGGTGNFCSLYETIAITSKFHKVVDEDNTHFGKPYCKKVTLSTLSGFTKTDGASIDIPGMDSDKDEINTYLNNGFYIE